MLILMYQVNTLLFSITLLVMIILIISSLFFNRLKKTSIKKYFQHEIKINNYLIESLASVEVIKGMHFEKATIDRFKYKYKKLLEKTYLLGKKIEAEKFIKTNLINLLTILILGVGSYLIINKEMLLGELLIFQSLIMYYLTSMTNLILLIDEFNNYKLAVNRIEDLYTITKENFVGENNYPDKKVEGDIKFNNLTYSYSNKKLYNNLNLVIKNKEKILIFGSTGTGKSTLMKLLARYLECEYGMISIGNIDINHYHLAILRKNITYVSQTEYLYTDTIYNNITLKKDIDEKTYNKIIKITKVDEIIKKTKLKENLIIEENGFNLSGGERQRIILARSLLKNSNIYIFDESINQVDIKREREILIEVIKYLKQKTLIMISHRVDNKDLFTRVISLTKGVINEE